LRFVVLNKHRVLGRRRSQIHERELDGLFFLFTHRKRAIKKTAEHREPIADHPMDQERSEQGEKNLARFFLALNRIVLRMTDDELRRGHELLGYFTLETVTNL